MPDGSPVEIALEDDPTPLVRILGATLRRSARRPQLDAKLRRMKGVVTLKSSVDPQAVTIRFASGKILVEHGVAPRRRCRRARLVAGAGLVDLVETLVQGHVRCSLIRSERKDGWVVRCWW
mgnify:CR=1 FL=1